MYTTIREGPNKYMPDRAGLERVPILAAKRSDQITVLADDDDGF
jgi:hypothetical protein